MPDSLGILRALSTLQIDGGMQFSSLHFYGPDSEHLRCGLYPPVSMLVLDEKFKAARGQRGRAKRSKVEMKQLEKASCGFR